MTTADLEGAIDSLAGADGLLENVMESFDFDRALAEPPPRRRVIGYSL